MHPPFVVSLSNHARSGQPAIRHGPSGAHASRQGAGTANVARQAAHAPLPSSKALGAAGLNPFFQTRAKDAVPGLAVRQAHRERWINNIGGYTPMLRACLSSRGIHSGAIRHSR